MRLQALARLLLRTSDHAFAAVSDIVVAEVAAPQISLRYSYWLSLLLAVPAAGFLVRLFMIQHDCGHGSFFRRQRANDGVGRVLGVLTLAPYARAPAFPPRTGEPDLA